MRKPFLCLQDQLLINEEELKNTFRNSMYYIMRLSYDIPGLGFTWKRIRMKMCIKQFRGTITKNMFKYIK